MTDGEFRVLQRRRLFNETFPIWWLKDLAKEVKYNCVLPLSLCDYYSNRDDIEIAAVVECLLREPLDDSALHNEQIIELHNLLGSNPSRMVEKRNFLHLLPDCTKNNFLGITGIRISDIFNTLDWIWEIRTKKQIGIERVFRAGLFHELSDRISIGISDASVCLLKMRMCLTDGVGKGLWSTIPPEDLRCPPGKSLIQLVRKIYSVGMMENKDLDEVISFLGFDNTYEFVYVYWGCRRFGSHMDKLFRVFPNLLNGKMSRRSWLNNYKNGKTILPDFSLLKKS